MSYARLSTNNSAGLNPNFRGLGQANPVSVIDEIASQFAPNVISPLPQYSSGAGAYYSPQPVSAWSQFTGWMGSDTVIVGVPNSIVAVGAAFLLWVFAGRRR
jgi:hypothetical protein